MTYSRQAMSFSGNLIAAANKFGVAVSRTSYYLDELYVTTSAMATAKRCGYCWAAPGEKCVTASGRTARSMHHARWGVARGEIDEPHLILEEP